LRSLMLKTVSLNGGLKHLSNDSLYQPPPAWQEVSSAFDLKEYPKRPSTGRVGLYASFGEFTENEAPGRGL